MAFPVMVTHFETGLSFLSHEYHRYMGGGKGAWAAVTSFFYVLSQIIYTKVKRVTLNLISHRNQMSFSET